MGRQLLADEPAFAAAVAELEPLFVEQVGFSLQRGARATVEPVAGIDRIQPVLVGTAAGADDVVAVLRRQTRCGDRPFDGRGDRSGGRRRVERRPTGCR